MSCMCFQVSLSGRIVETPSAHALELQEQGGKKQGTRAKQLAVEL